MPVLFYSQPVFFFPRSRRLWMPLKRGSQPPLGLPGRSGWGLASPGWGLASPPSSGISPGEAGNSSCRDTFQMKAMQGRGAAPSSHTEDGAGGMPGPGGAQVGLPGICSLLRGPFRWRSWAGRREAGNTLGTGCARSLSLLRSAFLLPRCFLTHFLSSQQIFT